MLDELCCFIEGDQGSCSPKWHLYKQIRYFLYERLAKMKKKRQHPHKDIGEEVVLCAIGECVK